MMDIHDFSNSTLHSIQYTPIEFHPRTTKHYTILTGNLWVQKMEIASKLIVHS